VTKRLLTSDRGFLADQIAFHAIISVTQNDSIADTVRWHLVEYAPDASPAFVGQALADAAQACRDKIARLEKAIELTRTAIQELEALSPERLVVQRPGSASERPS
jgi:hypothetical protein